MAVWEDDRIANICSQMPNLTIMATNAVAAVDQPRLSQTDRNLLAQHARETCNDYCAGCSRLCSETLGKKVPINGVMRCLMYAHSYQDFMLARATFNMLPAHTRAFLTELNFDAAERSCPRKLPIGKMMREAAKLLA
jgi:predicted aldo/keto reductase-like oxidoreductase